MNNSSLFYHENIFFTYVYFNGYLQLPLKSRSLDFCLCVWRRVGEGGLMNCLLDFLSCAVAAAAKFLQSCPNLCEPMDCSPPGSSVPGILQARIMQWVAFSFSNACMHAKSLQSCLTLCDPIHGSPSDSSVCRILQARILEWVAFPSPFFLVNNP